MRSTKRTRMRHGRAIPLAALCLAAACTSATDVSVSAWEGTLTGIGPSGVSGSVAMVSQYGRTDVSILLSAALPDTTYGWRINRGTCTDEGDLLGGLAVYQDLDTNSEGTVSRETTLSAVPQPGGSYAARVLLPSGTGQVVACGELARVR